ncbi:MAG TPA: alpha/beta hydrolase [Thermomicrobiales bacterium]|jgi:pimeloyl-ACP methyl ester carboxylesterase
MAANASEKRQALAPVQGRYSAGVVTSTDGTRLGYRQLGTGPGVVVLHGTMESAESHMQLAEALADTFTVYLLDRRGRGLSGPTGEGYGLEKEIADVAALLAKTGAAYLFGVSSGGIIALRAALALPVIQKIAIYEPPLFVGEPLPAALLSRYEEEMAEGKVAAALTTAMLAAQMGPPIFRRIPRTLLELLTRLAMRSEDKKAKPGDVTMRMLAPTLHNDFRLVVEMADKIDNVKEIRTEVLLLGGSNSPAYLKAALDALARAIPGVQRTEFAGLNHGGSGNSNRGGRPERVAQELCRFFARPGSEIGATL